MSVELNVENVNYLRKLTGCSLRIACRSVKLLGGLPKCTLPHIVEYIKIKSYSPVQYSSESIILEKINKSE